MITKEDQPPPQPAGAAEAAPCTRAHSSVRTEGSAPPEAMATAPQADSSADEIEEVPVSGPVRRRRTEVSSLVLKGCIAQEEPSFRAFVACYEHWVFAIVSRRLGYGPHVEDLAQEIFTRAHMAFPNFEIRDDTPPSSWLGTIARHLVADEKRKHGIQTIATQDPDPGYAPALSERAVALRLALSELPEKQCEAFLLHELEGMSLREVGAVLKVAPNTARAYIDDAIASLKRRLLRRGIAG
jgi:RNA polymerase sigma factor (sigma-70 family)